MTAKPSSRPDQFTDGPLVVPRISLNKLGEYLIAKPTRRKTIIRQQKEPPAQVVPLYQKGYAALEAFFATRDYGAIRGAIRRLREDPGPTKWHRTDRANTALGLERFLAIAEQLDFVGCEIQRADPHQSAKFVLGGLTVSVRPDFYIRMLSGDKPVVGALKFHWSKDDGHSLTEEGGAYVATTLHEFVEGRFGPSVLADRCFSVDVFREEVCSAPKSFKRLRSDIISGCEEIVGRWNTM